MAKLSLPQIEGHLRIAVDVLGKKMDASEFKECLFETLFLKRCSDVFDERREQIVNDNLARGRTLEEAIMQAESPSSYAATFFVPKVARWSFLRDELHDDVETGLNKALAALERENPPLDGVFDHIDFNKSGGKARIPDQKLRELIRHFSKYRLRNDDFEFPDLLGAAYEYLLAEFANVAGKRSGEFYTPRDVVQLMVRLLTPTEGMRIYDPCVGTGGMLILSKEHVEEHGGDSQNVRLYGQDKNGSVGAICKMNMILHGIADANIQSGDTLINPLHAEGNELMRFDRVISNPLFSQNSSRGGLKFPERFRYGFCPETDEKGDLMFVQHMLAVLRPNGMMATVMPQGVLFCGGAEKQIRTDFVTDGILDAVIGLPPSLFYRTGIPTCILVMRAERTKPTERRGKVLFINADTEYDVGRVKNYLHPEHVEKIVSTFARFRDIPGYAAVVSHADLAANNYNLDIRRYTSRSSWPERQDVCAPRTDRVPKVEVAASSALVVMHSDSPFDAFSGRDRKYSNLEPTASAQCHMRPTVGTGPDVHTQEVRILDAFRAWWTVHENALASLPSHGNLMATRAALMASFADELVPNESLDRFKVSGAIASWWNEFQYDLKTLVMHGFDELVDGWVATIRGAIEDPRTNTLGVHPLEHELVEKLLPEYLDELAKTEMKKGELEARLDAATQNALEAGRTADDDGDVISNEEDIDVLKKEIADTCRALSALHARFVGYLEETRATLTTDECRQLVLNIFHDYLVTELLVSRSDHEWPIDPLPSL